MVVDLEKIKREVDDVCKTIGNAFISLSDRSKEVDEAKRQIDMLKDEIVLLNERKANAAESAREEERISNETKKEHTEAKNKYRKLIDEEKLNHYRVLGEHEAEIEAMRMKGMSLLKSEQAKIISEIETGKQELANIRKEYRDYTAMLKNLRDGIKV